MKNIHFVLVQPPIGKRIVSITPALGLPYLAAILEKKRVRVSCIVADAEGLNVEETAQEVVDLNPDVVGFSIATNNAYNAYKITRLVREKAKDIIFIAGGPHSAVLPEDVLNNGIDYVCVGEGERTISDFVDFLWKKKEIEEGKGVSYFVDGKIKYNERQPLIENLDELPYPAWHLFPIDRYHSEFKKGERCLPIMTSRGCPGQCIFCYKGLFGNRFRVRGSQSVVDEIEYLKEKFKIDTFDILDDYFTAIPKRAIDICKLLIKRKINLSWGLPSGIRVDTASKILFQSLKEAGCYRIGFGVESGNDEILKIIKKFITKAQVRKAVGMAKKIGFEISCFFIIGNLGETEKTVNDTIEFAKELDPDIAQFTMAIPYPGSEMFNILKSQNRITSFDWDDYDYFKASHQVFRHENLEFSLIQRKIKKAYRSFYFRPRYIYRKIISVSSLKDIINLFKSLLRLIGIFK